MGNFSAAKQMFDAGPGSINVLPQALVPVDGKQKLNIVLRGTDGKPLEEYYKWQFVYSLLHSGLYAKDYIGIEVRFPKGNKASNPLRLDGAVFDDPEWLTRYNAYWTDRKSEDLEWLNAHLLAVIEFKRDDREMEKVFSGQIKPAMREKDPSNAYVLGIYYDTERLYLFHRRAGAFLRYDEAKNQKKEQSGVGDLSLHLPDPYSFLPSFDDLKRRVHRPTIFDRSKRGINDLDVITSIATVQPQDALSNVLRALDRVGLVNQRGYQIFIETFALKIFDEKRNHKMPQKNLQFYVRDEEAGFATLAEKPIQAFITRMKGIFEEAESQYQNILSRRAVDWKNINHIRAVVAVCQAFQDFSFVRSSTTDLYQLVFYNFANQFKRNESAQFLTPLPVIQFLVEIVNPRNGESVIDPCCGIADFLSLSFVHSRDDPLSSPLDDANIYGIDLHDDMIMLASLNMLLNGDGEAKLFHRPDKGSILWKIESSNPPQPVELLPSYHKGGRWDHWPDTTKLLKFDVVLTNPPFGEDRAYRPVTKHDREVIEMYETWSLSGGGGNIDLGVVFLVCKPSQAGLLLAKQDATGTGAGWYTYLYGTGGLEFSLVTIGSGRMDVDAPAGTTGTGAPVILAFRKGAGLSASGISVWKNGTSLATTILNDTLTGSIKNSAPVTFFARSGGGNQGGGEMPEVLVCSGALSDGDMASTFNYFNSVYGVYGPPSPPAPPLGLIATAANGQVTLHWSASARATSYNIKHSMTSGGPYTTFASPTTTGATDTGLTNGTVYYYVVSAVNGEGESADSSQSSAIPVAPPPSPVGLTATPGNAQVSLAWSSSAGAANYHIKRSYTNGGPYTTFASPTTNSVTDTGLTNGEVYYYVVTAVNGGVESLNSGQASAAPTGPPSAPTGLSPAAGNGRVSLFWGASPGATSYNVKRSNSNGGPYTTLSSPTTTSYVDKAVTNDSTYYYVVSAQSSGGESANSNQVSATPSATSSFNPDSLPGLAAWWRASNISGVPDAGGISLEPDSSRNHYDATQLAASKRPVFLSNGMGDQPSNLFDGVTQQLEVSDTSALNFDSSASFTLFIVCKPSKAGWLLTKQDATGTAAGWCAYRYPDGAVQFSLVTLAAGRIDVDVASGATETGVPVILAFRKGPGLSASGISIWKNGVRLTTRILNDTLTGSIQNAAPVTMYGRPGGGNQGGGEMPEVLAYSGSLSDADMASTFNYFSSLYGVSNRPDPATTPLNLAVAIGSSVGTNIATWTNGAGATATRIQQSLDDGLGWTTVGTASTGVTTFTHSPASPAALYRVINSNAAGDTAPSNVAAPIGQMVVAGHGNSITAGFVAPSGPDNPADAWSSHLSDYIIGNGWSFYTRGKDGYDIQRLTQDPLSGYAAYVDPTYSAAARDNILIFWEIINSVGNGRTETETWSDIQSYVATARASRPGWKILIGTGYHAAGRSSAEIDACNELVRQGVAAGVIDGVVDFAREPAFADTTNGASFYPDGVHLNPTGQLVAAQTAVSAIHGLYQPLPPPSILTFAVQHSAVDVSWPNVRGAYGYTVYKSTNGGGFVSLGTVYELAYRDSGVSGGDNVSYQVTSLAKGGEGAPSPAVSDIIP